MALVSEYQGFIFDYGGVLVEHQRGSDVAKMARTAGIGAEKFEELYWANRVEYDKGAITYIEYWNGLAQAAGKALPRPTVEKLVELDSQSWMHFDTVMWDWVKQLRAAGKRAAMLSNMPAELGHALRPTGRLEQFDSVVLSYEARAVKPDPAIYELCLDGLGTAPGETLFMDDRIENITAGEQLGIRGIEFLNRDDVLVTVRGY
jgi:putative hydrolase of the HAD superfamily